MGTPPDDYDQDRYDESENFGPRGRQSRQSPLLAVTKSDIDWFTKTLLSAIVGLLGFISYQAWVVNREMGEMQESQLSFRREQQITNGYFDRRLTYLEERQ